MDEERVRQIIREELRWLLASDRVIFEKKVQFLDGRNIQLGLTTGTKIGTSASQKLGFFNATAVSQRLKANYNNWAAASDIVNALVALGLFDQA